MRQCAMTTVRLPIAVAPAGKEGESSDHTICTFICNTLVVGNNSVLASADFGAEIQRCRNAEAPVMTPRTSAFRQR
jgi:hypothetical protein